MVTRMDVEIDLAFYGDDFTGSTDALESLATRGVRARLFFDPPTDADADLVDSLDAVGVAGRSRSMSPAEMDATLPPAFEALVDLDPEIIHYKVCSTFDSSSSVGSIGHAIDLGVAATGSPFVPVVVAAPSLAPRGRYVAFGNLFARQHGEPYRLDRHPTMRRHPVTPMTEADIRRHLGAQTDRTIGLVDVVDLEQQAQRQFTAVRDANDIVVFDGISADHQRTAGQLIWNAALEIEAPIFAAASSGLGYGLTAHWQDHGTIGDAGPPDRLPEVERLLVMSGSAAPETAAQIEWALSTCYRSHRLDSAALIDPATSSDAIAAAIDAAGSALTEAEPIILYTARGPEDPAIATTNERADQLDLSKGDLRRRLGTAQGRITRAVLEAFSVERLCVAGGDTSGLVASALDIRAVDYGAPVAPGSPICIALGDDPVTDGLELAFKGGQVATESPHADYFERVRLGGSVEQTAQ